MKKSWINLMRMGLSLMLMVMLGGVFASAGSAAAPFSDWAKEAPNPLGIQALWDVLYDGNGKFVAVGNSGYIIVSSDGKNWTTSTTGTTTEHFRSVAYGNGIYIAVALSGAIYRSTDAMNWTAQNSGTTNALTAVEYGNGLFIVGGNTGTTLRSTDGINWTAFATSNTNNVNYINYMNGNWLLGYNTFYSQTSSDGVNWTPLTSFSGTFDAIYFNGMYMHGTTAGKFQVSATLNPGSYSLSPSTLNTGEVYAQFKDIFEVNGTLYILDSINNKIIKTTDASTFTQKYLNIPFSQNFVYGSGVFVLTTTNGNIYTSNDAEKWTSVNTGNVPNRYTRIVEINGDLFAMGNSNPLVYKKQGYSWIDMNIMVNKTSVNLYDLNYLNGNYIGLTSGLKIAKSTDLSSWTLSSQGSSNNNDVFFRIIDDGSKYVTFGKTAAGNPLIYTSSDLVNWTQSSTPPPFTNVVEGDIIYRNGLYIAGHSFSATSYVSTDLINWQSVNIGGAVYTLQYFNGYFYAGLSSGFVARSVDGITWEKIRTSLSESGTIRGLSFGNNMFFAGSSSGKVYYTRKFTGTWTPLSNSGFAVSIDSSLFYGGKFYAVGSNGLIYSGSVDLAEAVTYDGNGNTGGTVPAEVYYSQNDTVTVSGNTGNLVKTSATFGGWNTAADGTGTNYAAGATFTMGSAPITLYAKWNMPNVAPTNITLSASTLAENTSVGTIVGSLSAADLNPGDTATFTLVSGSGSTDNASFTIDGTNLKSNAVFDYESKNSYSVRIRVTDSGNLTYEKSLTIGVTNVNEVPVASNVSVGGNLNVNKTLTANYTFSDPENDAQGVSQIQWYLADDAVGTNRTAISGATTASYILVTGDLNKYISFEVTPVAANGATTGALVQSSYAGPVKPAAPVVTSVSVPANGTYTSGQTIDLTVATDQNVTVDLTSGKPRIPITLDTGGTVYADYVSGTGSSSLLFRYTVARGTADANGIQVGAAIELNGATIQDSTANALITDLNGVGTTTAVLVDGFTHVTVSGITATDRAYDGTNLVTVNLAGAQLNGVQLGDTVTIDPASTTMNGTIAGIHVGNQKTVSFGQVNLTGTDAGYYKIDSYNPVSVNILKASLTLSGNRGYDGSTKVAGSVLTATGVNGETFGVTGNGDSSNLSSKNVQSASTLASVTGLMLGTSTNGGVSTNYHDISTTGSSLTITAKPVTLTAPAVSKTYDGTKTYTTTANELTTLSGQLGVSGDTVTGITLAYTDQNAGTATKTVVPSAAVINDGNNGANYAITYANHLSSTILPKEVTISGITASNKVYDGTRTAVLDVTGMKFDGLVLQQVLTPAGTAVGEFDTKDTGAGKTVTITGLSLPTNAVAANYVLSVAPVTVLAEITKKPLNVLNVTVQGKTYDGGVGARVNAQSAQLQGVESADVNGVQLNTSAISARFSSSGTGSRKVSVSGFTLTGANAGNYMLNPVDAQAFISQKPVTVTGIQVLDKMYDGTVQAKLSFANVKIEGLEGDNVRVDESAAVADFDNKFVGQAKKVTVQGLKLQGDGAENYSFEFSQTLTASITAKPLTVSGIAVNSKKEDGSTATTADFTKTSLNGLITGDMVSANTASATASFADATAGENKPVTISGVTLQGTDTANYTLTIEPLTASIEKNVDDPVVLVNGEVQEKTATAEIETIGDQEVVTVSIDPEKLEQRLQTESKPVVTIPVKAEADVVVGELNAQMVKNMEVKEATLEIKTDAATYTLPASQINVSAISQQIGTLVALKDIKIQVSIAKSSDETVKVIEDTATKNNLAIVVKPIEFEITATTGDKHVEVTKFNSFVERTVAIPDGVDPSKITTGVRLNADGTLTHVPTVIEMIDGKYYARINSLTNSAYSVIWNVKTFADIQKHWAKSSIENMASRLIVNGKAADAFDANGHVTRAEFASMIVRALGLSKSDQQANFKDIQAGAWYFDAIRIANQYGLIKGYEDGNFRPDGNITREEATIILGRAMKLTKMDSNITDVEATNVLSNLKDQSGISRYAHQSVALLMKAGVMSGFENRFLAKTNITRGETAATIERMLQKANLIEVKK